MILNWRWWLIVLTYAPACALVSIDSDGGFENVVVAISPQVSERNIEKYIQELKDLFTSASQLLHNSTRGQTFFKGVVFSLPRHLLSALPDAGSTDERYFREPDVIVTSGDAFAHPYAVQNEGCGRRGLRVQVPEEFLSSTAKRKDRDFIQEWVKYRYGVFDESGFVGDELYPACFTVPGATVPRRATDCTNGEAEYEFRQESSKICSLKPKIGKNNEITSSLMNKLDFPEVNQFCDSKNYPHNRDAPSKQNALCNERSTWGVISQHSDFKFKPIRSRPSSQAVSFKYSVEPDLKLIVAVDTSSDMAQDDRLDMVRNAFSYFVLYNLPENSVVGLKDLKNQEINPLLITVRTPADAERLIDAFPEAYGKSAVCVHCGMEMALQALKTSSGNFQGQIVVISANDIDATKVKSVETALSKNEVKLHVIYFKRRLKEPPLLHKLTEKTGGSFFYIPEGLSDEYSTSSLALLYEAFRSIYESFSWSNNRYILVDHKTFLNSSCSTCSMSFQTDSSMEGFQVLLTGPQFVAGPPVVKDATILNNGNQEFKPGHSSFSYKIKIPAYMFSIKNPKAGKWTLTFERKSGSLIQYQQPLVVIVRSTSTKDETIFMNSWVNIEKPTKGVVVTRPPVSFNTEVKKRHLSLWKTNVVVSLYHPISGKLIKMDVFDNGDGDPDITANDGLFSRYFAQVPESGYYVATFEAESTAVPRQEMQGDSGAKAKPAYCCGSTYPNEAIHTAGLFKRVSVLGFYLEADDMSVQLPPKRIFDLRVHEVMQVNNRETFVLEWTAPGNVYDSGTAMLYHLRLFRSRLDAWTNFTDGHVLTIDDFHIHGQILEPLEAGTPQSLIVDPRDIPTGTYFFAMRTFSFDGRMSEVSNVVEIFYKQQIPIVDPSSTMTDDTDPTTELDPESQPISLSRGLGLALAVTCSILFCMVVVGIFICFYCARSKKLKKEDEALRQRVISEFGGGRSMEDVQKADSRDALCQSSTALNISVISPVNSWPADSLLSHYETVKRSKGSDTTESSPLPTKDTSDSISLNSSKSSYVQVVNQDSSVYGPQGSPLYASVAYPPYEKDQVNFPYNPSYLSYSPSSSTSLRRTQVPVAPHYSSTNTSYYRHEPSERGSVLRLATDL